MLRIFDGGEKQPRQSPQKANPRERPFQFKSKAPDEHFFDQDHDWPRLVATRITLLPPPSLPPAPWPVYFFKGPWTIAEWNRSLFIYLFIYLSTPRCNGMKRFSLFSLRGTKLVVLVVKYTTVVYRPGKKQKTKNTHQRQQKTGYFLFLTCCKKKPLNLNENEKKKKNE